MSSPVRFLTRRALLLAASVVLLPFPTAQAEQGAVAEISPPEARTRTSTGEMMLIDVRTPEEWRETGVAPGVTRINMYDPGGPEGFTKKVLDRVGGKRDTPIAVICRSGNRSGQVQRLLAAQGFTRVYNVSEGMSGSSAGPGWINRGLPVEACKNC